MRLLSRLSVAMDRKWIAAYYRQQEERIAAYYRRAFAAAEEILRTAWPDHPDLIGDLRFRTQSQAAWASLHREWFLQRWPIEALGDRLEDWQWDAADVNPWSYLQDCLGIRGLMIVVAQSATADDVRRQLSASAMSCATELQIPELASIGDGRQFLHELAALQEANAEVVLVQLCENWDENTVVSCLPKAHLPELERLALIADIYEEGIRRL